MHANRSDLRRTPGTDADGILRELSSSQHLTPHRPLGQVVGEIVDGVGACPAAANRAMSWLELDRGRSIGRLRRGELIQLARAMYRFWAQAISADATQSGASQPVQGGSPHLGGRSRPVPGL